MRYTDLAVFIYCLYISYDTFIFYIIAFMLLVYATYHGIKEVYISETTQKDEE